MIHNFYQHSLINQQAPNLITQADHWLREINTDENGFITEEQFEEGVRRTRINTELYVRLLAKDRSFRLISLNTFKSIVCEENQ